MDVVWDGVTQLEMLSGNVVEQRNALADAAKSYNWPRVFEMLSAHPEFVNSTRPGGSSLYTPLHHAAHAGASVDVAQRLVELKAWRTIQNGRGERPVDVAERHGQEHLIGVLTPEHKRHVPAGVLLKMQQHFHAVIRGRIEKPLRGQELRLPELEPLLELDRPHMWFPVPGMYGGFSFRLESAGVDAKLVSESWCRVVGGSGQRHEITSEGSRLVEEGFV
jgi:hypothetical protein